MGLDTEKQRHIDNLLHDYDPNLSLRRIPDGDPAFSIQKPYGVYEENILAMRPWVFTLSPSEIDERVLARIMANDFTKQGAPEKFAKLQAHEAATQLSKMRRDAELAAEREDEMRTIADLASRKTTVRHRIDGELMILGDEITTGRTHI